MINITSCALVRQGDNNNDNKEKILGITNGNKLTFYSQI